MATVYRATDHRLDRTVAVKVMHEGLGEDEEFTRTFDREARAAAHLSHPNIVSVFDQGSDDGRQYIVMELVEGTTLRRVISREAPLPPQRALDLIDPVLAALAAAHEAGLIHRDVKPENVLISRRGQLKVVDFGLARAVTAQTAVATQGLLVGTVSYLPPELVEHGVADTRSDVYAAGIVLFEMLTGRKPHTGKTPIQVAYAHVHRDIPAPSTWVEADWRSSPDGIPPYLDMLVQAATSRDPDERPDDARAFLECVRIAREALAKGIMQDPKVSRQLRCAMQSGADTITVDVSAAAGNRLGGSTHQVSAGAVRSGASAALLEIPDSPAALLGPYEDEEDEETGNERVAAVPIGSRDREGEHALPDDADDSPGEDESTATTRPGAGPGDDDEVASTGHGTTEWAHSGRVELNRETRARRAKRGLATLALVAVLTGGGVGTWWLADGRYVDTPQITDLTRPQASAEVAAAGLSLEVSEAYSETVPKGEIIASVPEPGANVARGGTVTAVVSKGPERYAVPSVVGLDQQEATRALEGANLVVGDVSEEYDEEAPAGQVTAASHSRGESVKPGTPVDLVVSRGREPIEVANWHNRNADDAVATLAEQGLRVVTSSGVSEDIAPGRVMGQTPNSGTLHRGDTVQLTISQGSARVPEGDGADSQADGNEASPADAAAADSGD